MNVERFYPRENPELTLGKDPETWTDTEKRLFGELGYNGSRLTLFKMCKNVDGRILSQSPYACAFGCPRTEWIIGTTTVEPHSTNDNNYSGLYAFALTPGKVKNVLRRPYHDSSWTLVLVELFPENYIGINGSYPLLSGEVFLKASALNVLDITDNVPSNEEVGRMNWKKTVQIGSEARSWSDVKSILQD